MNISEIPAQFVDAAFISIEELEIIVNERTIRMTRAEHKLLLAIYQHRVNDTLDYEIYEDFEEILMNEIMEDPPKKIKEEPEEYSDEIPEANFTNHEELDIKTEPMDDGYEF
jgi:hypothetical protein